MELIQSPVDPVFADSTPAAGVDVAGDRNVAIRLQVRGAAVVVQVTGEIDVSNGDLWRTYLERATASTHRGGAVVVDLSHIGFLGAAGMAPLFDIHRACNETGKSLYLVKVPSALTRLFNRTSAEHRIPVRPTVADVLAELRQRVREPVAASPNSHPPANENVEKRESSVPAPLQYAGLPMLFARMASHETGSPERSLVREEIVIATMPLAEHIARRFRGRGEPYRDLVQVARLGLLKAIDRFDPTRGEFLSFAIPTIMGEIRRYFRDYSWTMHVPRAVQETSHALHEHTETLAQKLGRAPTVRELAAALGRDPEDITLALTCDTAYQPDSLDAPAPSAASDNNPIEYMFGAEDPGFEHVEQYLSVKPLIEKLPERERSILIMRFFDSMTQTQIAQRLGISQMHVSRILAKTLGDLRSRALADGPTPTAGRAGR